MCMCMYYMSKLSSVSSSFNYGLRSSQSILLSNSNAMLVIFCIMFCASQIDCTTESKKCTEHNIHAFPTLKLFKDGREVGTVHVEFNFVKQG